MVTARCDETNHNCRFEIRPNRSLSWERAKRVFGAIAFTYLLIAGGFALMGFWPVLPFAGLELLVLGWAMYRVAIATHACEIVDIDAHNVAVCKGLNDKYTNWKFPRAWVQVQMESPSHRWYASRLWIGSHGRRVRIGAFLNEGEREALATSLLEVLREGSGQDPTAGKASH